MSAVPDRSRSAVRRLAVARLVSVTGGSAATVALAVALYARTGSAEWVSAALLAGFAVPALASPLSGALGDRFDRRRVLIASDLAGAACLAGMALASAPALLLALAFAAALAAAPFLPASAALVAAVAAPADLPWANARLAMARTVGSVAGPALGGGLVALTGAPAAFWLDALSFAVSAGVVATLRGCSRVPETDHGDRPGALAGVRLVLADPTLRALTLGFVLVDVGNGLVLPAEVALARVLRAGAGGYGALVAAWGVGGVLGAHWAPRLLARRAEPPVVAACAAALALAFGAIAVVPWLALALAGFAVGGAAMSVAGVGEDVLLARRVADRVRGRVYATHLAAVQLSLAVPLLFAGLLVDALGPRAVFGVAAGAVALGVAALAALLRPGRG